MFSIFVDSFAEFCSAKPEYGLLFTHFLKLKEDSLTAGNITEDAGNLGKSSRSLKSASNTQK